MKKQVIIILVVFSCLVLFGAYQGIIAFAEYLEFEQTNVLDDLQSSTVNGQAFDITDYPYDDSKDIQLISFIEYCYSYKVNMQANYGLYVYVYNPKGLSLDVNSTANKIQIAVLYDDGLPSFYDKFNLEYLSRSTGDYSHLFYKFKVIDKAWVTDNKTILQRVNSNERRYDVSGIELVTNGNGNATDYKVGGTFTFTGYAAGYGSDTAAASTLSCDVNELETIELQVHDTMYRSGVSSLGEYHQNQLNSVYFSIDNCYLEEYGKLQKILAEWWEYKTSPIVVTKDNDMYNRLLNYRDEVIVYDENIGYSLYSNLDSIIPGSSGRFAEWSWNGNWHNVLLINNSTVLPYLEYANVSNIFDYTISGDYLKEYINWYPWSSPAAEEVYNGYKNLSGDLFSSTVDEGRTRGYNCLNIDSDDTFDVLSYDSAHNWLQKLFTFGFENVETGGDYYGISPIYVVQPADILGTDEQIAARLLIDVADVLEFKSYYAYETALGNVVYLFRFGMTDYYSRPIIVDKAGALFNITNSTYMAQQTLFFNFDIIQLTFNRDGVYRVIPVVSDPIDIIGSITPPVSGEGWFSGWLNTLLMAGALILLLVVLVPILPYIIKGIIWVITLPFKLIGKVAKSARHTK